MVVALTRAVPAGIAQGERTHLARELIDLELATEQHRRYEKSLAALGCTVQQLPGEPDMPDSVFIEDMAVVLPELAIITRSGAEARRAEIPSVAEALRPYRSLVFIEPPGTIDGGDVLCIGSRIFIGESVRTNKDGIRQFDVLVSAFGYKVQPVPLSGCLHLKTAVTQVDQGAVLLNPAWIDREIFAEFDVIDVNPAEPFAANALWINGTVLFQSAYPRTQQRLERAGLVISTVSVDELTKAEAGLTCCSLLVA